MTLLHTTIATALVTLGCVSCASSTAAQPSQTLPVAPGAQPSTVAQDSGVPLATAHTATPGQRDAPEISRGVGTTGGVVVFWPRVSPRTEDPATREIASRLQGRLRMMVERAMPGRSLDVRPEPERVCPRQGCTAMTVGAMLSVTHGACVALALVSSPGTASQRIIPWGGRVDLRSDTVPFREPPEPQVVARDMVPCADLIDSLAAHDDVVVNAIRSAAPAY